MHSFLNCFLCKCLKQYVYNRDLEITVCIFHAIFFSSLHSFRWDFYSSCENIFHVLNPRDNKCALFQSIVTLWRNIKIHAPTKFLNSQLLNSVMSH